MSCTCEWVTNAQDMQQLLESKFENLESHSKFGSGVSRQIPLGAVPAGTSQDACSSNVLLTPYYGLLSIVVSIPTI